MNTRLALAAAAGLVAGPQALAVVSGSLPLVEWATLMMVFVACALALPVVLALLAAGSHYKAMVRSWSVGFVAAVFVVSAGATALVTSASAGRFGPQSLFVLVIGGGLFAGLGSVKWVLFRIRSVNRP